MNWSPLAALDPATRASLVPELAVQLRNTKTAAVIVTHDATDARALADRRLVLDKGCIAQCDRTDIVLGEGSSFGKAKVTDPKPPGRAGRIAIAAAA